MERKIRLLFEYDGTNYSGLQIQAGNLPTIQNEIEQAIKKVTGQFSRLISSGRTDAGVHSLGQVAHFITSSNISEDRFAYALNAHLPKDISILKSLEVDMSFDARRMSKGKIYRYQILNRKMRSSLLRNRAWHISTKLDVQAMQKAAAYMVGEHDFSSFRASGCASKSPIRRIYLLKVEIEPGDIISIEVFGTAFLKQMVRNIVGTLVDVGYGKITPEDAKLILEARDRTKAGPCAKANGLTMIKVFYEDDPPPADLQALVEIS